jgi:hypothetical protein
MSLYGNFFELKTALRLDDHEPLVFDPEVLERYKQNPKYRCSDSILYCNDPEEIFDIARIFTGKNNKGEKRIAVYLVYLLDLPASHQPHWLSYLKQESFKIDRGSYEEGVKGEFTRHIDPITAIYWELKEINNLTKGNPFFVQTENEQLKTFAINSREKFINYCLELNKLLIENIKKETFTSFLSPQELHQIGKTKGNKIIKKLQKIGEKFNCSGEVQSFIDVSQKITSFRIVKAHHVNQDTNDENYILKQEDITKEVYKCVKTLRKSIFQIINPKQYKSLIYVDEVVIE